MKNTETSYRLITDLPLAGKNLVKTRKEWKRIYGYEVGLVPGARFVKVSSPDEPIHSRYDVHIDEKYQIA